MKVQNKKTEWHPAMYCALKLELRDNKEDLEYKQELELTSKPIRTDMMILKKNKNVSIKNPIGHIFREHNLIEYKSPDDALNIDTFYKTIAYASFYKINTRYVNEIKASDMTITFIREGKPKKLISQLDSIGMNVRKTQRGVYIVENRMFGKIQIIVTKELNTDECLWITSLTKTLSESHAKKIIAASKGISEKDEMEYVSALMEVVVKENEKMFHEMKGVDNMCNALRELMQPEFEETKKKAMNEGREKGIEEGIEEGRKKGKKEGIDMLSSAVLSLSAGRSEKQLSEDGYDEETIEKAVLLYKSLHK